MGIPTSWPILCIYNMWMHARAWEESGLMEPKWIRDLFRVIGDDYVALLPKLVSDRYTNVLLRTGGFPSPGKDLEAPLGFIFGEEAALVTPKGKLVCARTVSVRSLLGEAEFNRSEGIPSDIPPMLSASAAKAPRDLRERICVLSRESHADQIAYMKSVGIPPFLPREVGGGGYPVMDLNKEFRREKKFSRAIRILLSSYIQNNENGISFAKLTSIWTSPGSGEAPGWAWESIGNQIKEFGVVSLDQDPDSVPVVEAFSRLLAVLRTGEELAFGIQPTERDLPALSQIGRRIRKVIEEVNSSVPLDRLSDKTKELGDGLMRMRQEYLRRFRVRHVMGSLDFAPTWSAELLNG